MPHFNKPALSVQRILQRINMKPIEKPDNLQYTKERNHMNEHDFCSRRVTGKRCPDIQILYDRQSEPRDLDLDIDNRSQTIGKLFTQCLISLDNIKQFLLKPKRMRGRRNQWMSNTTLFLRDENSCMVIKERKKKRIRKKGKRYKRRTGRRHEPSTQDKVQRLVKTYFRKINLLPVSSNISYNRKTRRMLKKKIALKLIGNKKSINVKIDGSKSKPLPSLKDILYKWTHNQFKQTLMVYPVSGQTLNNYLDSIGNTSQLPSDSMQFELIRLQTFSRYPENAPVRPIRLAEAGFYHTGNGTEVRCYSCGKTYTDWKQGDSPRDIHLRISPHCVHIRRNENENITMESGTENRSQSNSFENNPRGVEQTQQRHSEEHSQIQAQTQQQNNPSSQQQQQQQHQQQIQNNTTYQLGTNTTNGSQPSASRTHANSRYDPLGINFDRPKYQAYAVLAVRISSFHGWPSHLTQSAREMATAGYFYAGYSDYCRCFFCGGGLRNWDAGDDPWVEHARWFPRCQFLRMNKGFGFIELVQQRLAEVKNGQEHVPNVELTEGATGPGIEPIPKTDDIWSHPSIQSVLQMGYSRETIGNALSVIKDKKCHKGNDTCASAAEILETIFAMEQGATCKDEKVDTVEPEIKTEDKTDCNPSLEAVTNGIETVDITDTQSLIEENRQLKEDRLCKICMDNDASIAFLPCGHLVCCGDCAPAMRKCPVCRDFIRGTVKTWLV